MADTFGFTNDFQDLILACLIRHSDKFTVYGSVLKPKYFHGVHATIVARSALAYHTKTGKFPSFEVLGQLVAEASAKLGDIESKISDSRSSGEYVQKLARLETSDVDYVVSRVIDFARERALIAAAKELVENLKTGKTPEGGVVKLFEQAVSVGNNVNDLGYILHEDYERVVRDVTRQGYGVRTGYASLDAIWKNGWGPGWLIVPLAPPKRFKCLGKDTLVLTYDGSTKKIQDVVVGDLLMGDDSTPRTVLTCGEGFGPLYSVKQDIGTSFVCNDAHVLCVQSPSGEVKEIEAKDYAVKAPWFRQIWKAYKVGIDFKPKSSVRCGMELTPIGDGKYYGVTIDGNSRFLLADFTVTHNSTFCTNLALNMVSPQIAAPVFYYPCEISAELTLCRALANIAGNEKGMEYMYSSPEKFLLEVKSHIGNLVSSNFLIKGFSAGSASIADIKAHAKTAIRELDFKPKAIFIDYAETIRPNCPKGTPAHLMSASVYTEAREMGQELGVPVIMPDRCNKETTDRAVPSMTSFQGAFSKAGIVDVAIGLCGTDVEINENKMRYFVFLNRHGKAFQHFTGRIDPEMMRMAVGEEIPYDPEEDSTKHGSGRRGSAMPEELHE